MNLDIRALTYDLLDDYLDFFDNIAFSDNKEWSGCYCVHFHLEEESLRSAIKKNSGVITQLSLFKIISYRGT